MFDAIDYGNAPESSTRPARDFQAKRYVPPLRQEYSPTLDHYLTSFTVPYYLDEWTREMRRVAAKDWLHLVFKLPYESPWGQKHENKVQREDLNRRKERFWTVKIWGFTDTIRMAQNAPELHFGEIILNPGPDWLV